MLKLLRSKKKRARVSGKVDDGFAVNSLKDEDWDLYIQPYFRNMMNFEIRRAERSKSRFLLVLISIDEVILNTIDRISMEKFREAFDSITRETDIKGWYREKKTIGIIYTDMATNSRDLVLKKVKDCLKKVFGNTIPKKSFINTYFYPEDLGKDIANNTMDCLDSLPEHFTRTASHLMACAFKRTIDIIGSIVGIIIFSPVFILVPIIIKMTSTGPVFFKQKRVGYNGQTFKMLKFRSMSANNNVSIHQQFMKDFIKNQGSVGGETKIFKMVKDPRVTPIGQILRKSSLDEIPQFFNILFGEMSLVGPRPAIHYETEEYQAWHKRRFLGVKPGLTGFWQVYGRSTTNFDTMIRMDIHYARNWTPMMDLVLLCKTPFTLFTAKGAY